MAEIESIGKPRIVKSHDIHLDGEYADWIAELKHRYRSAQVKASVRVNSEKLLFNWELGRDLVKNGIYFIHHQRLAKNFTNLVENWNFKNSTSLVEKLCTNSVQKFYYNLL